MPRIFISYRRTDSPDVEGRIYERFAARFGRKNVFKDIDNIPVGTDFRAVIEDALFNCHVMLVIIGPNWLDAADANGKRRLDNPEDFVRIEVELGLRHRNVHVIPVLVNEAHMPPASQLPPSLHQLSFLNAAIIRNDPDFEHDIRHLLRTIEPHRSKRWIAVLVTMLIFIAGGVGFMAFNGNRAGNSTPTEIARVFGEASEIVATHKVTPSSIPTSLAANTPSSVATLGVRTQPPTRIPTATLIPIHGETFTSSAVSTGTETPSDLAILLSATTGHLRIGNFTSDKTVLGLYIDGLHIIQLNDFTLTEWFLFAAGKHNVGLASADGQPITVQSVEVPESGYLTVVVTGKSDHPLITVLVESFKPPNGQIHVGMFNAVETSRGYNIRIDGHIEIFELAYPGLLRTNDGYYDIYTSAGEHRLEISGGNVTDRNILFDLSLDAEQNYFVAIVGSEETPALQIISE